MPSKTKAIFSDHPVLKKKAVNYDMVFWMLTFNTFSHYTLLRVVYQRDLFSLVSPECLS